MAELKDDLALPPLDGQAVCQVGQYAALRLDRLTSSAQALSQLVVVLQLPL
jgi:hypothetical protein